jgi:D-sedoheptulose 7-phosphate isomerase
MSEMEQQTEQHKLAQLLAEAPGAGAYAAAYCERLSELLAALDHQAVDEATIALEEALNADRTVFLIGNGGSASACTHFANDLSPNSMVVGKSGFRVISLTDNVALLTAIANDSGYAHIFSVALEAQMRPGDVVVAMSVSGNSPNIVKGVEYANAHGGVTIGWTGFDGGRLAKLCHHCIHTPTAPDEYGPVEDVFSILGHLISGYITMKRGGKLHH